LWLQGKMSMKIEKSFIFFTPPTTFTHFVTQLFSKEFAGEQRGWFVNDTLECLIQLRIDYF